MFKKVWSFIRRSKRRTIAATVLAVLIPAGTALAFYLLIFTGSASTTGTLNAGGQTSAGKVTVTSAGLTGLAPGQSAPYTVTAQKNAAADPNSTVQGAPTVTFSTTKPGCNASWFTATDDGTTTYPVPVTSQLNPASIGKGSIKFTDNGQDQSACQSAVLTVNVVTP